MARRGALPKLRARFPPDELEAGPARRVNAADGKVWGYVIPDDGEDEEGGNPRVKIVTEEYWLKNGYTFDHSLGDEVRLPDGFHEVCEAEYEFDDGDLAYAEELLQKAGFKKLGIE